SSTASRGGGIWVDGGSARRRKSAEGKEAFLRAEVSTRSDNDEFEVDLGGHGRDRVSTRGMGKGKGQTIRLTSENDDARPRPRPAAAKQFKTKAKPDPSRGDRPVRLRRLVAASSSDEGFLEDSDSEGENFDRADSSAERVQCRCGAKDWEDGEKWIRCDGRNCWMWEHSRCAYPSQDEEAFEAKTHICLRCTKKGGAVTVRSLARDAGAPTPERRTSSVTSPQNSSARKWSPGSGVHCDGGREDQVRRSRRVAGSQRGIHPLIRKGNLVREMQSSSEDDDHVVLWGYADSEGNEERESDDSDGKAVGSESDDGFTAPEGKVDVWKELRCRCGATREGQGVVGMGGTGSTVSVAVDSRPSGRERGASTQAPDGFMWVECRSDHCGIWEHAVCCDFGCADDGMGEVPRVVTKHWCRVCDPKGTKHRKNMEKKRKQQARTRTNGMAVSGRGASGTISKRTVPRKAQKDIGCFDDQGGALLHDLWKAVATGDISRLEKVFHAARRDTSGERRLLNAKPPPLLALDLDLLDHIDEQGAISDTRGSIPTSFPSGLTLVMLAAGYWRMIEVDSMDSAELANDSSMMADEASAVCDKDTPVDDVCTGYFEIGERSSTQLMSSPVEDLLAARENEMARAGARGKQQEMRESAVDEGREPEIAMVAVSPKAPGEGESQVETKVPPRGASETRLNVLRLLLKRNAGSESILAADGEGRTAAHHAAAVNGAGEVELLLKGEKTAARAALMKDNRGYTPLHVAALAGHAESFVAILKVLPVNLRAKVMLATEPSSGDNALHLACAAGHEECAEAFFNEEIILRRELSKSSTSPWISAEEGAKMPKTPLVTARNSEGSTPLMMAAGSPTPQCLKRVRRREELVQWAKQSEHAHYLHRQG
ncbi:unnamed protein product, partial [Sphacelaria rigidula]